MRGIFVKIYLAFLFTSIVATLVTLILAAYYREWSNESINLIAPTGGYISAAELTLQYGGEPLLIEWLLTFQRHPSVNAYVFDSSGLSHVSYTNLTLPTSDLVEILVGHVPITKRQHNSR